MNVSPDAFFLAAVSFERPVLAWSLAAFAVLFASTLLWMLAGRPAGMPRWYRVCSRFLWLCGRGLHRLEIRGKFQLPEEGGCIIVANHTCGADPLYLAATVPSMISFMIAREVYELPYLKPFAAGSGAIPVSRSGVDTKSFRETKRTLDSGRCIAIFPEGGIQLDGLAEAKAGAALLAAKSGAPVIPVYMHGTVPSKNLFAPLWSRSRMTYYVGEPFKVTLELEKDGKRGKAALEKAAHGITERILEQRALAYAELGVDISGRLGPYAVTDDDQKSDSSDENIADSISEPSPPKVAASA